MSRRVLCIGKISLCIPQVCVDFLHVERHRIIGEALHPLLLHASHHLITPIDLDGVLVIDGLSVVVHILQRDRGPKAARPAFNGASNFLNIREQTVVSVGSLSPLLIPLLKMLQLSHAKSLLEFRQAYY